VPVIRLMLDAAQDLRHDLWPHLEDSLHRRVLVARAGHRQAPRLQAPAGRGLVKHHRANGGANGFHARGARPLHASGDADHPALDADDAHRKGGVRIDRGQPVGPEAGRLPPAVQLCDEPPLDGVVQPAPAPVLSPHEHRRQHQPAFEQPVDRPHDQDPVPLRVPRHGPVRLVERAHRSRLIPRDEQGADEP
jgi:hypothetical protein